MTADSTGSSTGSSSGEAPQPGGPRRPAWTFLTNHGHVLLAVARDPDILVADIAGSVGITARAALLILKDLESAGYLRRERVGRRTRYTVNPHQHFRHPATAAQEVDGLISLFAAPPADGSPASGQNPDCG
jgi:hypothetical protein